jgi:predicted PurR-regulated permease PerM
MTLFRQPIFMIVVSAAVFLLLAWYFSDIFLYVIVSLVLATLLRPMTNYISNTQLFNLKVPRVLAVFFSFAVLITILSFLVLIFIPLISEQIRIFTSVNYDVMLDRITLPIVRIENLILESGWTEEKSGFLIEDMRRGLTGFLRGLDVSSILENVISLTGSFFLLIIAVTFITFFLLFENGIIRKQFLNLIPNNYFEVTIAGLYKIERLLSNYLLGLLLQMTSIFTIAFVGLSMLGIKYAASIALFAAISNLIPYLGPILGAVFGIIVGLSTSGSEIFLANEYVFLIVKIVAVFATVQLSDNLLLQPLIFSKSVKAHPLEIFIIIFAGATLAGIPGMIAAIPAYTVIRVLAFEIYKGYKSYHIFKIE